MNPLPEPSDDELADRLMQSRRLEDAPRALVERALGIWSVGSAPAQPGGTTASGVPAPGWVGVGTALVRRVAALISDSGFAPAPAWGLRSAGGAAVRQILLQAEGRDIDLRVSPAADGASGWVLGGQLLGPDERGEVQVGVDTLNLSVQINELGEFRCGPLPAGRWLVVLRLDALTIELPPIEVPGSGAA